MFQKLKQDWEGLKASQIPPFRLSLEIIEFIVVLLVMLTLIRQCLFERRFIPSESMLPLFQIGDQLIVEKLSLNWQRLFGGQFERGDVVVFYPPAQGNRGIELSQEPLDVFVRLSGISSDVQLGPVSPFFFLPKAEDAFIKRIVGLPGDKIEVRAGRGLLVNDQPFYEPYLGEAPDYSLKKLSDIPLLPAEQSSEGPIIVPANSYFCLGDNRNQSHDGHIWGFVPRERIVGRAYALIWRDLTIFRPIPIKNRLETN